jgi:hypothetical protein
MGAMYYFQQSNANNIGRNQMVEPIPFRKNETCDGDDQNTDTPASEESHTKEDLRTYTNEEVSEIIRLALRSVDNEDRDTVSHSEMLVIGKDFGLSPEDIERAFVEADKTQQTEELEKQARIIFFDSRCHVRRDKCWTASLEFAYRDRQGGVVCISSCALGRGVGCPLGHQQIRTQLADRHGERT